MGGSRFVWKMAGYRASSFSYSGRIIYKVEDQIVTVVVVGNFTRP